jgi:hypothetical protein
MLVAKPYRASLLLLIRKTDAKRKKLQARLLASAPGPHARTQQNPKLWFFHSENIQVGNTNIFKLPSEMMRTESPQSILKFEAPLSFEM